MQFSADICQASGSKDSIRVFGHADVRITVPDGINLKTFPDIPSGDHTFAGGGDPALIFRKRKM